MTFFAIFLLCILSCVVGFKFAGLKHVMINHLHSRDVMIEKSGLTDPRYDSKATKLHGTIKNQSEKETEPNKPSPFDQVASKGLAGVLAIACAEAIFWAAGMPLAAIWYKFTTGEWIDLASTDGQLKAAGFSFGYGGFATAILQYRVTLFAIPLVPIMEKFVVIPGKKLFGDSFGNKKD